MNNLIKIFPVVLIVTFGALLINARITRITTDRDAVIDDLKTKNAQLQKFFDTWHVDWTQTDWTIERVSPVVEGVAIDVGFRNEQAIESFFMIRSSHKQYKDFEHLKPGTRMKIIRTKEKMGSRDKLENLRFEFSNERLH